MLSFTYTDGWDTQVQPVSVIAHTPAFLYLDELPILHGFPWSGTLDHGKERVNLSNFPGLRARLSEEIPSPTLEHRDRTVS